MAEDKVSKATLVVTMPDGHVGLYVGEITDLALERDMPPVVEYQGESGYEEHVLDDPRQKGTITLTYTLAKGRFQWLP